MESTGKYYIFVYNILEDVLNSPISVQVRKIVSKKIPELEFAFDGVITETQAKNIKIIKDIELLLSSCH